ncbi:tripartite motif-containing 55-like [Festucalex cinctus]
MIDELEEMCRKIEESCKTHEQNVCDKFRRLFSILDGRLVAMTERISYEEEEKAGRARMLARCYGDRVAANRKLLEKATCAVEDPDTAAFVQNSKELITKVKGASNFSPPETFRPSDNKMRQYKCNFRRQERAVAAINFIAPEDPAEPTQNTETEPSETEDAAAEAPLWHSEPPLALSEGSIQDVNCEEEQLPLKERMEGEAKELSHSQEAQIDTQQAVIVLFYLVAFLVLLQKVCSCVGCFI